MSKKKEMTEDQVTKLLIGCGREMAEGFMEAAVTEADDADQMGNQIFTLEIMGANVLAINIYNQVRQKGMSKDDARMRALNLIDTELADIYANEKQVELIETKAKTQ